MTRIPALHVGQATPVGPVTLFPVWADVRPVHGLLTAADAQDQVAELHSEAGIHRWSPTGPHGWRSRHTTVAIQRAMRTDGAGQQHSVWDGVRVSAVTA